MSGHLLPESAETAADDHDPAPGPSVQCVTPAWLQPPQVSQEEGGGTGQQ